MRRRYNASYFPQIPPLVRSKRGPFLPSGVYFFWGMLPVRKGPDRDFANFGAATYNNLGVPLSRRRIHFNSAFAAQLPYCEQNAASKWRQKRLAQASGLLQIAARKLAKPTSSAPLQIGAVARNDHGLKKMGDMVLLRRTRGGICAEWLALYRERKRSVYRGRNCWLLREQSC